MTALRNGLERGLAGHGVPFDPVVDSFNGGDLSLGSTGSCHAEYVLLPGKLCFVQFYMQFAGTGQTEGTGGIAMSLPFKAAPLPARHGQAAGGVICGQVHMDADVFDTKHYEGHVAIWPSNGGNMRFREYQLAMFLATGNMFEQVGTATVATSGSSVTVSHGLVTTPAGVMVWPITTPSTSARTEWWVDTLTATQFTLHATNAGAALTTGMTFGWRAFLGQNTKLIAGDNWPFSFAGTAEIKGSFMYRLA